MDLLVVSSVVLCYVLSVLANVQARQNLQTCSMLDGVRVPRLPRFDVSKYDGVRFNSVLLYDTRGPRPRNVKFIYKAVNKTTLNIFEVGRFPNQNECSSFQFQSTQSSRGEPCTLTKQVVPTESPPGELLFYTPDRNTLVFTGCFELAPTTNCKYGMKCPPRCSVALVCVTTLEVDPSRRRLDRIKRQLRRIGIFRAIGIDESDLVSENSSENDCEFTGFPGFPDGILPQRRRVRPNRRGMVRRRKKYRY